jgi:endonuclease/exonuclease/phosphatase family metal-dependent hydrolase
LRFLFLATFLLIFMAGLVLIPRRIPANPEEPIPERSLSVVSLNMAKETDPSKIVRALDTAPRLRQTDLFLLQEVVDIDGKANTAGEVAHRLGYFAAFAAAPGVHDQGLALMSRYPIRDVQIRRLKRYDLGSRSRSRFALAATVGTPWGDVRLWNAHLDTRINAAERLEQLQPVMEEAARCTGPRLIGGDFNTNDVYWLRNRLPLPGGPAHSAMIRRALQQHGFETPFPDALNTFPALRRHLDWIFVRDLRPLVASIEPAAFSDHNAVWVCLSLEQISGLDGSHAHGRVDKFHSEAETVGRQSPLISLYASQSIR